jgi:hypothetical protein
VLDPDLPDVSMIQVIARRADQEAHTKHAVSRTVVKKPPERPPRGVRRNAIVWRSVRWGGLALRDSWRVEAEYSSRT